MINLCKECAKNYFQPFPEYAKQFNIYCPHTLADAKKAIVTKKRQNYEKALKLKKPTQLISEKNLNVISDKNLNLEDLQD